MDLSKKPYLDRFNSESDYTKVLYKPDTPLQAAELNEQQSIVNHYLGQVGDAIFTDGNVQSGMDYLISDGTITVHGGQVYLAGKVRKFRTQVIPFSTKGKFEIGIKLKQRIITHTQDPKLLDQTSETVSYYSPGADRMEETVLLVANDPEASVVYTFVDGDLFTKVERPEMSKINDVLAERTYDESGNYRVNGFDIYTEAHKTDSSVAVLVVEPGRAYVRGYQVDKPTSTRISIPKSTTVRSVQNEGFYYNSQSRKGVLGNKPVANVNRVSAQVDVVKSLVTRGNRADTPDALPHSSIFRVSKVWTEQPGGEELQAYVQGKDFQLINGNSIDWSPSGNEPPAGRSYYVNYSYTKAMVLNTDYKVTTVGEGDGKTWWIDFNGTSGNKPLENTLVLVDYDYYLARKDLVVLDRVGAITIHQGQPDATGTAIGPNVMDPYTLPLGTILLYPNSVKSQPSKSALNRLSMADLQKLKTRIENLEYNEAVNALDKPAMENSNPLTLRGVFSDGFISFDKADLSHPDHKIAFSFDDAEITLPYAKTTAVTPTYVKNTGLSHSWGRLVTAPFTEVPTIAQPNVTEAMNVNPYNVFNKQGILKLTPSEDNWIEESRITVTQQETSTMNVKRWWRHTGESWVHDEMNKVAGITLDGDVTDWAGKSFSYDRDHGRTGTTLKSGGQQTIENMIEFMRQIDIQFEAQNLQPNSNNLTINFDGIRCPITPASGFNKGTEAGSIMSNASGVVKGTFKVPAGIRTGTREVTIRNGDNTASTNFIAQGTHKTTQDIIIRTRVTINLTDPLAQSFQFDQNHVVTSFGLYFGSKSNTNNILIQVRNITEGGMPGKTIFGETQLKPSEVKVSDKGTEETRVYFDDPIVCDAGKEYCVVAITDNDDYTMWIATRGQTDLRTGETVNSNPYLTGVLYSSSNASAWTIHQDSDLKFAVYTALFNPQAVLEFQTMSNVNADTIVLMSTFLTPENTACAWDMKVVMENEPPSVTIDSKSWLPIGNYVDMELGQIARQIKLKATFTANENISPLMSVQDLTFGSFLSALQGSYVGRAIDMSEAPFNTVKIAYDAFTPLGTTVTPRYSTDGGKSWKVMATQPTTTQESREFTKFVFDEKITDAAEGFKNFRVRLDMQTSNSFLRPRSRRLMVNLRNE